MTTLAITFRNILNSLRGVIAALAPQDSARQAVLLRIHQHIGRTIARFERLFTQWREGTLPPPRAPCTRSACPRRQRGGRAAGHG
jgi:hypothetical protein